MARAQIRIKKGDEVYVLSGKEKGKTGKVMEVDLALVDPESKKPTRIGTKLLENGKRVRVAKRSGAQIDQA
jgi:ribosomal protein L24